MKISKQTKTNLKRLLKSAIIIPVVGFATLGDNQICINFVYFFNFFVSVTLLGFLGVFDKVRDSLTKEDIPNEYLYFSTWIIPICLFVAGGWLASAILWFLTWSVARYRFSQFLKEENDKQDNDTRTE
jgi:hypothetical protein